MKSRANVFTLRDLNRRPAKVLEAVRKYGSADIRTRGGEEFVCLRKHAPGKAIPEGFPDFGAHWQRLRELGLVPPPPSEDERINCIIAGEL